MAENATERHTRNALHQHLPLINVVGVLLCCGGGLWWVKDQARDIIDARRIAESALLKAEAAAVLASDQRVVQAEVMAKLSGIEVQLADLRALFLRGKP